MTDIDQNGINNVYLQYNIIFDGRLKPFEYQSDEINFDLCCLFGTYPRYEASKLIAYAIKMHVPIITMEEGFIETIFPANSKNEVKIELRRPYSAVFDDVGIYYFGGAPSRLEQILNSDSYSLDTKSLNRSKQLMETIRKECISKYNYQPIVCEKTTGCAKEKVLVIDQVWNDQAIRDGLADDAIFDEMLDVAIKENPNADILVKTHPVTLQTSHLGHYSYLQSHDNVYKIDAPVNPISLLEQVDKVYVCTSQMGFEALMCGKEVHVFGMPFYAGWGVTHDRLRCPRRTKKRTVEEIFYAAYIKYSVYVSYKTNSVCEIEQAIDELLELREEYWSDKNDHS